MDPLHVASRSVLAERLPSAAASDFVEWGPRAGPEQRVQLVLSNELNIEHLTAADPRVPAIKDDQSIN